MAITNLTNTTRMFKGQPSNTTYTGEWSINFTSNGESFTSLVARNWGRLNIGYNSAANKYMNSVWTDQAYRTITITGGADVENAELIAFLQLNTISIPEFTETKTALKIYEDLTAEEYSVLEKDNNTFYLVNDVGIYKGEKLISQVSSTPICMSRILTKFTKDEESGKMSFSLLDLENEGFKDNYIYFVQIYGEGVSSFTSLMGAGTTTGTATDYSVECVYNGVVFSLELTKTGSELRQNDAEAVVVYIVSKYDRVPDKTIINALENQTTE